MFLTITIFEMVLILTGLFSLRKGGPVILYILLSILIIDFINENIIVTHSMGWWKVPSNVFYNIYSILEIAGWMAIYYLIFEHRALKKTVIVSGIAILFYSFSEVLFIHSFEVFHTTSYTCFSLASLIFSAVHLYQIDRKESHISINDVTFWVCAGAICFNIIFLVNLFTMSDSTYWQQSGTLEIFHALQSIAIIIFYILICISFIISFYKRQRTITQAL